MLHQVVTSTRAAFSVPATLDEEKAISNGSQQRPPEPVLEEKAAITNPSGHARRFSAPPNLISLRSLAEAMPTGAATKIAEAEPRQRKSSVLSSLFAKRPEKPASRGLEVPRNL